MGIVRFALRFPYTFYVLAAFILLLGISTTMVMPEDIFPEIDIPVVSVIWQYTGRLPLCFSMQEYEPWFRRIANSSRSSAAARDKLGGLITSRWNTNVPYMSWEPSCLSAR